MNKRLKEITIAGKPQDYECGLPGWLNTGTCDVFFPACIIHDQQYLDLKPWESTKEIDRELLVNCLELANGDPFLKARALVYYRCARIYGIGRFAGKSIFSWPWGKQ